MKENKCNDETFFNKYGQMKRSKEGLSGAGEWEALKRLLPDFKNKQVLDLGCGYGWHSIYAAGNGAKFVIGVDLSERMIEIARDKTSFKNVKYQVGAMEDVDFPDETFDVVMSSLAFHYVEDFSSLAENVFRMLKSNGVFVFTVEHPIFTADGSQNWIYNEDGEIEHFPVDNYFEEGQRETQFLDEPVTKYHRTMTTYINTLINAGFNIQRVIEPTPPEYMMDIPNMKDELRRPMMLIISARKN
ncbi:MAG TPA: class I SAM-dependent methyltransferase [Aliicoccus persicus]|uniref:Class I SAM-dependent methyltransferase n=1 Tax=Aliicoccus persicus TaxID=930138 RepID=A0A921JB92_9STAP|nr:class I SAM-dependent methyltransferase [Aliicoccus persicus]